MTLGWRNPQKALEEHRKVLVRRLAVQRDRIDALEAFVRMVAFCEDCDSGEECDPDCRVRYNEQICLAREVLNGRV